MNIFTDIVAGGGGDVVPAAVVAILRRAEAKGLLFSTWSLAELGGDGEDYE